MLPDERSWRSSCAVRWALLLRCIRSELSSTKSRLHTWQCRNDGLDCEVPAAACPLPGWGGTCNTDATSRALVKVCPGEAVVLGHTKRARCNRHACGTTTHTDTMHRAGPFFACSARQQAPCRTWLWNAGDKHITTLAERPFTVLLIRAKSAGYALIPRTRTLMGTANSVAACHTVIPSAYSLGLAMKSCSSAAATASSERGFLLGMMLPALSMGCCWRASGCSPTGT